MSRNPYVRPMSKRTWFLRNGRYKVYIRRELSCLLVGFYSFLLIFALAALSQDTPAAWNAFLASQQNLFMTIFHAAALLYFLLYQTFAWFELAPKVMPLQVGENKLPSSIVVFGHYIAWAVITAVIFKIVGVF